MRLGIRCRGVELDAMAGREEHGLVVGMGTRQAARASGVCSA